MSQYTKMIINKVIYCFYVLIKVKYNNYLQ